jgi:phospholipid transport system substrate-binding protein
MNEVVRETTDAVLGQLAEDRDMLESDPESINTIVNELIVPHFDFEQMSSLVLGGYWDSLDEQDKSCFVSGFRNLLVERYAYILLSYDDHEIIYEPAREIGERGYQLVRQIISREGSTPLPVEYAMEPAGDTWKVVDLIIDGVSLVRNYRGMYQSQINIHGLEYFIDNFTVCSE